MREGTCVKPNSSRWGGTEDTPSRDARPQNHERAPAHLESSLLAVFLEPDLRAAH